MSNEVKYPEITVQLTGQDGNIFGLIGICTRAMRRANVSMEECNHFVDEVTSAKNYNEALAVIMRWVDVD